MAIWRINYRNLGKPEHSPKFEGTREQAEKAAEFYKLQGATSIRIHETFADPAAVKASMYFGKHSQPATREADRTAFDMSYLGSQVDTSQTYITGPRNGSRKNRWALVIKGLPAGTFPTFKAARAELLAQCATTEDR